MAARILDELTQPIRKLLLNETEIVALISLVLLDPDVPGLTLDTSRALAALRDRVQHALFQVIRERVGSAEQPVSAAISRFGNILLLLPPLAKISSIFCENVQFARVFGSQTIDPLVLQIFFDSPGEVIPSTTSRERADVSTQTHNLQQVSPRHAASADEEMLSLVQLTPPPTAGTLSTLSPVGSVGLPCSTSPQQQQQRITPIVVPPGPNGHANHNTSYSFYFPYSGQFSVPGAYPVQSSPASSSLSPGSASNGTYVSQTTGIFDTSSGHTAATDVTNNFRYL
ncbi:unnamed protein product [Gongylonema pulchrum]|uniref:NR LBD domain-containing protein n=1 Tax=Gongylonema pulchrum TaxID=637853 RepID=A0A183EG01_9BILA|nr:unnamed protein product [Gongylonema pulchrum]